MKYMLVFVSMYGILRSEEGKVKAQMGNNNISDMQNSKDHQVEIQSALYT